MQENIAKTTEELKKINKIKG